MLNELADRSEFPPYTRIARAQAELETLRQQAAEAVGQADQLEAQCAAWGLDPESAAWLTVRFERFLANLQAESDALLDHAGAPPESVPTAATPGSAPNVTASETTVSPAVPPAGLTTPAAAPAPAETSRAPSPVTHPGAEATDPPATLAPPDPLPIGPPAPGLDAPPSFDRAFWKDDEAPPWSARVTKRLRPSKANAYALGAVIAAALAVVVYLS